MLASTGSFWLDIALATAVGIACGGLWLLSMLYRMSDPGPRSAPPECPKFDDVFPGGSEDDGARDGERD